MDNDYKKEKVLISFGKYPFCFNTINEKFFTNRLKDSTEFHNYFKKLITIDLPHFESKSLNEYQSERGHTHAIREKDKLDVIKKCLLELFTDFYGSNNNFERFYENNISLENVWQVGGNQGLRLICTKNKNIFYVLFIDYYHQIYKNVKYNDRDISKNEYCPINNY